MATSAVPGAFPPVALDGGVLVDGGLTARAPVLEALAAGVPLGRALVLLSYAAEEPGQAPSNLRRTLEEAFEMAMLHQIRRDTELARYRHPEVEIQVLAPATPLRLRPLDLDPTRMAEAFARGRADALACLERWQPVPMNRRVVSVVGIVSVTLLAGCCERALDLRAARADAGQARSGPRGLPARGAPAVLVRRLALGPRRSGRPEPVHGAARATPPAAKSDREAALTPLFRIPDIDGSRDAP